MIRIFLTLTLLSCCLNFNNGSRVSAPELRGTWIQSDYISAILTTKSPYKAHGVFNGVSCLLIKDYSQKDTFSIGVIVNNHMGDELRLICDRTDKLDFNIILNESEGYSGSSRLKVYLDAGDTSIEISYLPKARGRGQKKFTRISREIIDDPFSYFVHKSIFAGHYDVYDNKGQKVLFTNVLLAENGSMAGMNNYEYYNVVTDYAVQPENCDLMGFKGLPILFSYEFKKNNIYLYQMKESTPDNNNCYPKENLYYILKRRLGAGSN